MATGPPPCGICEVTLPLLAGGMHGGHFQGQIRPSQNSAVGWEALCTGEHGMDRGPIGIQPFPATKG